MIDGEHIGSTFVAQCDEIIPVSYSETETMAYPYLAYEQTVEVLRDKDGAYGFRSSLAAHVVSDDFDDADDKAAAVADAVVSGMNDGEFRASLTSFSKDRQGGVWTITLNFTIEQIL